MFKIKLFKINFLFFLLIIKGIVFSQFNGNQTPNYLNLVSFYDSLANLKQVELYNMGISDYGLPIYLCVLNGKKDSLKTFENFKTKTNILVNNGIHPGEPDGINACGLLTLDFISKKITIDSNVTFSFTLCYNVDGMMNRNSTSRVNQNGPEEYGFRGNAQNLDLNRDFIKMDSENAFTFVKTFHLINPSIFVDTHVSDGADYQYVLTLIHAVKEKLELSIKDITYQHFIPDLEKEMKKNKIDLFPYVELVEETPDKGIAAFNDLPRYAFGYASLFQCISVTTETHMLKPFPIRVEATKLYLNEIIKWTNLNFNKIKIAKYEAINSLMNKTNYNYSYELSDKKDSIWFKGQEHEYKSSEVTGLKRLNYNSKKPYQKFIPNYSTYTYKDSSRIPIYYVVEYQCKEVIKRLNQNKVAYSIITKDSILELTLFRVKDYKNGLKPYEGHYLHHSIQVQEELGKIKLKKGDILIPTNQFGKNFICSVLEPETEDSYFAWNFFDSYIQEKEYFSDYVFEELATEILASNPKLKLEFDKKKSTDEKFAQNHWDQLYFIYQKSKYFEPSFMRLPVYKIY
jgi:hypothetical protein